MTAGVSYEWSGRATRAEIDLDAFEHNIRALSARAGEGVLFAAAVKGNAYGHGAVAMGVAAVLAGASSLAVSTVEEGVHLRRAGIAVPILVMGYFRPLEAMGGVESQLTFTVTNTDQVDSVANASALAGMKTRVHVKVDTGMHRYGVSAGSFADLCRLVRSRPELVLDGVYTHFCRADERDKTFTLRQYEEFMTALDSADDVLDSRVIRHASNSAAIIDLPHLHLDMVRGGISIYGLYGSTEVSRAVPLKPVMRLVSEIGRVHDLRPGDGVGYGHTYVASRRTRVALVPIGYADGYSRCLSNRAEVLVGGRRERIVGRISMDQLVVDVGELDAVQPGDEVVMFGHQGSESVLAEELAHLAGTIEHEVTGLIPPESLGSICEAVGWSALQACWTAKSRSRKS